MVEDIETTEELIKRVMDIEIAYEKLVALLLEKEIITSSEAIMVDVD